MEKIHLTENLPNISGVVDAAKESDVTIHADIDLTTAKAYLDDKKADEHIAEIETKLRELAADIAPAPRAPEAPVENIYTEPVNADINKTSGRITLDESLFDDLPEDDSYETEQRYFVYDSEDMPIGSGFEFLDDAIDFAEENDFHTVKVHNYYIENGEHEPDGNPVLLWHDGFVKHEAYRSDMSKEEKQAIYQKARAKAKDKTSPITRLCNGNLWDDVYTRLVGTEGSIKGDFQYTQIFPTDDGIKVCADTPEELDPVFKLLPRYLPKYDLGTPEIKHSSLNKYPYYVEIKIPEEEINKAMNSEY